MKKTLIVAYYFPPIATSGAFRPLNFCRYLKQYGWSSHILTVEPQAVRPLVEIDQDLCKQLPPGLQISRVSHANPEQTLLHVRKELRQKITVLFSKYSPKKQKLITANNALQHQLKAEVHGQLSLLKQFILDFFFSFPDPQRFWFHSAMHWFARIPREEYPNVVFATGGPWTSLLVGQSLARRFGVPFVADFRDPWTRNPHKRFHSHYLENKMKRLEQSVCVTAARVIANTMELRAQFVADYPTLEKKFVTITNGFDGTVHRRMMKLVDEGQLWQSGSCPPPLIELSHFGTVYGNRSPEILFHVIKELFQEGRVKQGELRVRFVGMWEVAEKSCERLAQELEELRFIQRKPPVPYEICLQQMASSQILLILQPSFPLQIPGKIYEYIATGRPLLVIGGEGATAHLVEQHGLGLCCSNQIRAIKQLLWALMSGSRKIDPPKPRELARFDYQTLTGELAQVLDSVQQRVKN